MLTASATDALASIPAGQVRLAVSRDIEDTIGRLSTLTARELDGGRLIIVVWDRLPLQSMILEEAINQLAEAALTLWPAWYSAEDYDRSRSTIEILEQRVHSAKLEGQVLRHWLALADKACQMQRWPRWPTEFTRQVESRQLALALGERGCRIVLAARAEEQGELSIQGLARAAEWLARETNMPLILVVPILMGRSPQLDSINFGMIELSPEVVPEAISTVVSWPTERAEQFAHTPQLEAHRSPIKTRPRPQLIITPLIGRPHPKSSGERLLWNTLEADPELAGLFRCNQPTETKFHTTHLVDFVYGIGKLVVEVDGYYWHKSRYKFAFDRHRDYELHASGYVVLRLPHDEVMENVDAAVDKIRRLVRMRAITISR
jgi:very-short-patch-repair endonuclease